MGPAGTNTGTAKRYWQKSKGMTAFRILRIAFLRIWRRHARLGVHETRITLHLKHLSECEQECLSGYMFLLLQGQSRVRVQRLPMQSTGGHLGYSSLYFEGLFVCRTAMMLQEGHDGKIQLLFLSCDQLSTPYPASNDLYLLS